MKIAFYTSVSRENQRQLSCEIARLDLKLAFSSSEINDMSLNWFIYSNNMTSGPYSTEEVRAKLASGQIAADSYVWWKGQREWAPISTWENELPKMLAANAARAFKPIWYIDVGSSPIGPLTQDELIENLKGLTDLGQVHLWSVGMPKWQNLFSMNEIIELLGLTRRENNRAPLMGTVVINRSCDNPRSYVLKAASVSVGGIGVQGNHDLCKDDEVSLLIKCQGLQNNIYLRGIVSYVTQNGTCGIRFQHVPLEIEKILLDFVNKFNPQNQSGHKAA